MDPMDPMDPTDPDPEYCFISSKSQTEIKIQMPIFQKLDADP